MPTLEMHNGHYIWSYIPSLPAAVIFTIIFTAMTGYHFFLMLRYRLWFCIPFVIGGVFEMIGYIGRIIAYNNTGELIPYVIQTLFLLLAPILFAASLYMTLSRVVLAVDGAQLSMIPPRWLTRIFVTADVTSFLIQAAGGGIIVQGGGDNAKIGKDIIVAGLVFQLLAFAVFCSVALVFNVRLNKSGRSHQVAHIPWQSILYMLYLASAFIMIRNIARTIEYAEGQQGYLMTHEWTTYVLDGMLMIFAMAVFAWWYPNKLDGARSTESSLELVESPEEHKQAGKV